MRVPELRDQPRIRVFVNVFFQFGFIAVDLHFHVTEDGHTLCNRVVYSRTEYLGSFFVHAVCEKVFREFQILFDSTRDLMSLGEHIYIVVS